MDQVDGNNISGGDGKETVHEQLEILKAKKYKRFGTAPPETGFVDQTTH